MAEVLLFHHVYGQTPGFLAFADDLRTAGHVVHTPDLYHGRTFTDRAAGRACAEEIGFDTLAERGRLAADDLPPGVVYAGFSLGVMPAQMLAQTRPGAKGALLFHDPGWYSLSKSSACAGPTWAGTELRPVTKRLNWVSLTMISPDVCDIFRVLPLRVNRTQRVAWLLV